MTKVDLPAKVIATLHDINARYGKGTIVILGNEKSYATVPRLPTGIPGLDAILDGGLPKSSLIELYGDPMSGKTTLLYYLMGQVQKAGGTAAFFDAEHGHDSQWAKRFGVDDKRLIFSQPDTGEQAINAVLCLIRSNVDFIGVDSVSALVPKVELEAEEGMEDQKMAAQARMMSKACRLMLNALKNRTTIVVFTNQYITPIGALHFFGTPHMATKGGLALKQKSRVRLELVRTEWIESAAAKKVKSVQRGRVGQKVEIRVTKSKVSPPNRSCQFTLVYYSAAELKRLAEQPTAADGEQPLA
jgi:recombination protein RecA